MSLTPKSYSFAVTGDDSRRVLIVQLEETEERIRVQLRADDFEWLIDLLAKERAEMLPHRHSPVPAEVRLERRNDQVILLIQDERFGLLRHVFTLDQASRLGGAAHQMAHDSNNATATFQLALPHEHGGEKC